MPLTEAEKALVAAVPPAPALIEDLRALTNQNSFTGHKIGVDKVADYVERRLESLGFRTACMVDGKSGRHVIARSIGGGGPRALLIGHSDTVHAPESGFSEFQLDPEDADRATGPGIADMKGGLVVMLAALDALHSMGASGRELAVVVVGDEEEGSPTSGDLVRAEAEESQLALVFECGRSTGEGATTIVTGRRGVGRLKLRATGAASHAGSAPGAGASAVLETAQKVAPLHALTDETRGRTVTVGVLKGGTTGNVVPAECLLELDYRFPDLEAGEDLADQIIEIASENHLRGPTGRPLVRTVVTSHLVRPPLVRTDAIATAAAAVIAAGADLGLRLAEESRGGSSDAALAAEVGCPAVCGLGVVGGDIHTDREWATLSSLRERATLVALTLDRFFRAGAAPRADA
jgi:glutamate carboxypeptidase